MSTPVANAAALLIPVASERLAKFNRVNVKHAQDATLTVAEKYSKILAEYNKNNGAARARLAGIEAKRAELEIAYAEAQDVYADATSESDQDKAMADLIAVNERISALAADEAELLGKLQDAPNLARMTKAALDHAAKVRAQRDALKRDLEFWRANGAKRVRTVKVRITWDAEGVESVEEIADDKITEDMIIEVREVEDKTDLVPLDREDYNRLAVTYGLSRLLG